MTEERAYWLAWSCISGIGPVLLKRIYQHWGSLKDAWNAPVSALGAVDGFGAKLITKVAEERSQLNPEQLLRQYLQQNPYFWTPVDTEYPRLLLETPSPPAILHYQGQIKREENQGITPMIGIVGTREPSEHGRRWTRKISKVLAQHGFTIVSGMADGIDGVAHQGCLEVGGRTIAVLGTGVDIVYPPKHGQLYEQILEQGLILSEYAAKTPPDRQKFPARNRIIAGLCRAVLVMEAPEKSGALITARYATEFNRDVYTLPNTPDNFKSRGCLRLIHNGAQMIIKEDELLEMLGAIPQLDPSPSSSPSSPPQPTQPLPNLEPHLAQVFQAIAWEPTPFDVIVQEVGLDTGSISAALLQLELLGLVSQSPGMRYQKV